MLRVLSVFGLAVFSILFASNASAQVPLLPDLSAGTEKAINFLTWNCQYDGIKSIAVQRSNDSVYNYITIGYVRNVKQGVQAYIDGHPLPGKNFYRLYIAFDSDLTWYSNRVRVTVSEEELLSQGMVLPPNDSLQKFISSTDANNPLKEIIGKVSLSASSADADQNGFSYIRSQYIYTNPLTGHVNIEVPEVMKNKYNVKFYDGNNKQVLEVPRVMASPAIIDKRNFQRKGIFKFVLKRNNTQLETGYITIY
ncbi:MAG TPA: hypothetical protein VEB40_02165 [Flavipsychrobacter sp.]|nr:hypothetical protein [Flavipsychrobacter sp.]